MLFFTEKNWCKFLWGKPCMAIETFYHWDLFSSGSSGFRRISLIPLHERIRRRIRLSHFCTLINIVTENAIVNLRTLPVSFPLPTISKNSLYTLFCSLILDHGVSIIISISGAKIPIPYILLDTSFHHRLQSVINRSCFLLMNLQVIQFQYGLACFRLVFFICTILPRCRQVGFSS